MNEQMNQRLTVTALAGSSCGLLFGYDIGAIAGAAPDLRLQFALSAAALGVAVSSALFGTIAGSMAAGYLADVIDRRNTLVVACLAYMCATLGAVSAFGFVQFAVCRLLCGFAIGLISVTSPMYLAEISPARLRGRLVGSFQLSLSFGVVLAFALGYVLSLHCQPGLAWRWLVAANLLPAALCEALLLKASPSPRWLTLKGRFAEARDALVALGSEDAADNLAIPTLSLSALDDAQQSKLFSRRHARPIALAVSIAIFNQLSGVNVLLYYILDVFRDLGSGHLNGRRDAILIASLSLLVTVISVSVIDKVGRKPLLLAGALGMGACLVLLPAIRYMHWPALTVVIAIACYNACFGFSQGVVVWVYLSEIFPLPVRARGQSLGSTVHWVINAIVVGAFPAVVNYLGGKVFLAFAVMMVLQFFTVLFVYPETKRASLESLASSIGS
jgi:sugar porter (SP) family MFS transporter